MNSFLKEKNNWLPDMENKKNNHLACGKTNTCSNFTLSMACTKTL